ncbi:polyprenyl synthetase family protein [Psychrobacter sp. I-STPA6b]|uniref:polyprenyl synthetase family protein n=1 Tax=Psychrobacter sp. I-STPA6b TaxID=2585718 RepID=UPI001D0C0989|nr:polyprenyl synthetase family protein [Psychrobacter sp. I-STPA6b]
MPATTAHTTFHDLQTLTVQQLNEDIERLFNSIQLSEPLKSACEYAVSGGGKRVRPLLVSSAFATVLAHQSASQLTNQATSQPVTSAFILNSMCRRAMLAVELLHAYSLVHDDLPCMDDDELRRGKPTCHVVYGEATALLVGDVLQTLAFEVLNAELQGFEPADETVAMQLLTIFAPRARRMVIGQMQDLQAEGKHISQQHLQAIHRDKTGALIEASVLMGGICGYANHANTDIKNQAQSLQAQQQALLQFAQKIGLAFQVQDDILDVTQSTETLGKPAGSDEKLDKSTYVKLMGIEPAKAYAKQLFVEAKADLLAQFTNSNHTHSNNNISENNALIELAEWLWQRNK